MTRKPGMAVAAVAMLWWVALGTPASAQQIGGSVGAPAVVRVEGLDEVLAALARLEERLEALLISRWEYRTLSRNLLGEDIQTQADMLGREGWELVGITTDERLIFKRRLLR